MMDYLFLKIVLAVLVCSTGLATARLSLAVTHHGAMKTLGRSDQDVTPILILVCVLNDTERILDFESRWSHQGKLIDGEDQQSDFYDRARVSEGMLLMMNVQGTQLIVLRLSYQDAGLVTCEARERASGPPNDWLAANVQVRLLVRLDAIAGQVHTFNDSLYVDLACDMAGYIRADQELYWTRNGVVIADGSEARYRVSYTDGTRVAQFGGDSTIPSRVSTLTVFDPEIEDSGDTYGCAINNTDHAQEIQLTVTEASSPSAPPENVTAVPLSPTAIMVTWDVVSESERNGNITSYDVTFSQVTFTEIPSNLSTATGGPQRSIVLQNLEEDVEYSIAVRARTIVGAGPYSTPTIAQTLQAAPTGYPANIQVTALSPAALLVSWESVPAIERNGAITHYTIQYNQSTFASVSLSVMLVSVNASVASAGGGGRGGGGAGEVGQEAVLDGLEEFVEYGVAMRAHTAVGRGPPSPLVSNLTLQDSPSAPPQTLVVVPLSSSSLGATWSRPRAIDINGILTRYIVTYCPLVDSELEGCTSLNAPPDVTRAALPNLQEFSAYNVSVAAYTVASGPVVMDTESTELITVETEPSSFLELGPASPVPGINITCTANTSSNVQPIWQWKRGEEVIITSGSGDRHVIHLTPGASTLEINQLENVPDSATYSCSFTFPLWEDHIIASSNISLQLNYAVEATAAMVTVSEGVPADLSCVLYGYAPSIDLQWTRQLGRGGKVIQLASDTSLYSVSTLQLRGDNNRVLQRGTAQPTDFSVQTVLTLLQPVVGDTGSYYCGLASGGGAMATVELSVIPVPTEGLTPATTLKPEVPVVGIVLGVVIGVFLLVLLAVAVIAAAMLFSVKYHKRSRQADDVTGEILVVTTSGDLPVDGAEDEEEEEEIKKVPLELLEQVSTTAVISDAQDEDIANLDATGLQLLDTHKLEQPIDEEMPNGSATPDEDSSTPETLAEPGTAESLCIVDASIDPVTPSPVELVTPDIDTPVELVTPDIDTPVELVTPDIDTPVELVTPDIDTPVELVTPDIDTPVELVTPDIDTPVELVTPDIDTPVELATPDIDTPVELATPDIDTPVELVTPDIDTPVELATPDIDTPVELATPDIDTPVELVTPDIDTPVELVTPDIDTPVELVTPDIDTLVELATLVEQLPADTNETATADSSASEKTNLLKAVVESESRSSGGSVVSGDAVPPNTTQRVREETNV